MFLSAICALSLNAGAAMVPASSIDRYIINGEQVENFDGSQLVGKTISDYKLIVAKGNAADGDVRCHIIRTDGGKITQVKGSTVIEGMHVGDKDTEFSINGEKYTDAKVTVVSTTAVYIIDGKKCDKEALNKIKPEEIAAMTVYKPGSKEAKNLSGENNVTVIKVDLRK